MADLCALADVRAWLQTGQGDFPSSEDDILKRLITAASQFIQTWIGRNIAAASYTEVRDGTGGQNLAFRKGPVTAVASVSIDGLAIPTAPTDGGFVAGYVFSPNMLTLRGYVFTRRAQNVLLTYTAGYATTPTDLAQACIELVCLRYKERARIGEISKSLGGAETVSYSQKDMSDDVKAVLTKYRAVFPA